MLKISGSYLNVLSWGNVLGVGMYLEEIVLVVEGFERVEVKVVR